MIPGVPSGDRVNWGQQSLRERSHVCFCEESLGKTNAKDLQLFRNGSAHEFYRLNALITLEQVNTLVVEKKNLNEQNFDSAAYWSSVVNFHCMQMSLVMGVWLIFGDDLNDALCSSCFWSLAII